MPLNTIGSFQPIKSAHTSDQTNAAPQSNVKFDTVQNSAHQTISSQYSSLAPRHNENNDKKTATDEQWNKIFHPDTACNILKNLDLTDLKNLSRAVKTDPEKTNFTNSYVEDTLNQAVNYPSALSNHQRYVMMNLAVCPALVELKNNGPKNLTPRHTAALEILLPGGKDTLHRMAMYLRCKNNINVYHSDGKYDYSSSVSHQDIFPESAELKQEFYEKLKSYEGKYSDHVGTSKLSIRLNEDKIYYSNLLNHAESILYNGKLSEKLGAIITAQDLFIIMKDPLNHFSKLTASDVNSLLTSKSYPLLSGLINYFPSRHSEYLEAASKTDPRTLRDMRRRTIDFTNK